LPIPWRKVGENEHVAVPERERGDVTASYAGGILTITSGILGERRDAAK